MITILHEFIIHLLYGYMHILSNRKISSTSPKKGNNFNTNNEVHYFDQIFFGRILSDIGFNDILVILNGENLNSLNEFQNNLGLEFEPHLFKVKSDFLISFLKEYPIELNNYSETTIHSTMKSINNGVFIKRDTFNIIRSYSAPMVNQIK